MGLIPKRNPNSNLLDISLNKQNLKQNETLDKKAENNNVKFVVKRQELSVPNNSQQKITYNNYKNFRKFNSSRFLSDKLIDQEKDPSLSSFKFSKYEESKSTFENLIEDNFKNKNVIKKINFQSPVSKRSFSKPNDKTHNIVRATLNLKDYITNNVTPKPVSDGLFKKIFKRNEANFRDRILPLINLNKNFNLK